MKGNSLIRPSSPLYPSVATGHATLQAGPHQHAAIAPGVDVLGGHLVTIAAPAVAPRKRRPAMVLGDRDSFQMRWVDALAHAAEVIDFVAVRDRPNEPRMGEAMPRVAAKHAVTLPVAATRPDPAAGICDRHSVEKSFQIMPTRARHRTGEVAEFHASRPGNAASTGTLNTRANDVRSSSVGSA